MFSMIVPAIALVLTSMLGDAALACSTCFGNPDSSLTKGAVAGVVVLVGIVGFVLLGVVGHGIYFFHRSRLISRLEEEAGETDERVDD